MRRSKNFSTISGGQQEIDQTKEDDLSNLDINADMVQIDQGSLLVSPIVSSKITSVPESKDLNTVPQIHEERAINSRNDR